MKTLLACLIASPLLAAAQAPAPPTCDGPEWKQFDFWVGDWDLSYRAADGRLLASRNKVTKILDGCVVLEQFAGPPGTTLNGRSVSTFDRGAKRWKQTWVDNTGGYLDFNGVFADGKMILARDAERQGKKFKQRMVWQDIRADALKWLWQRSDDGGATWSTQWEIDYRRAREAAGAHRPKAGPAPTQELHDQIAAADGRFFAALFDTCDTTTLAAMVTDDFEMYHDKGGKNAGSGAEFIRAIEGMCARQKTGEDYRARRELVPGSLKVYPLANYGAVQVGEHRFYQLLPGKPEKLVEVALFTNVWKREGAGWKLVRALSYDHRLTP